MGILGSITCINALSTFARNAILGISSERIVYKLRLKLFNSVLAQEVGFFDDNKTGELVNRLSTDTSLVGRTLTSNITSVFSSLIEGIGAITILFFMAPQLTLISLAVMPPVAGIHFYSILWFYVCCFVFKKKSNSIVLSVVFGRYLRNYSIKVQDALAASTDVAEERFSSVRTIRTFNQQKTEEKRYEGCLFF
jgi:ATP-binding cassette subfamily B (MDR/TAP) protein 10